MPRRPQAIIERDPIPQHFQSLEQFWEFWDTHSTADYEDQMHEVEFTVDLEREQHLVAIQPELMEKIDSLSYKQGVAPQTLINLWLAERMAGMSGTGK